MTERLAMDKPGRLQARPLADVLRATIKDSFSRRGFAATELVTRWPEIVGADIATHCAPERIQWPRQRDGEEPQPGTLLLRVDGPTAVEIQHLSQLILERVNVFFGWRAVAGLRLRQAPLVRRPAPRQPLPPDPDAVARIAAGLTEVTDEKLRAALARLSATVRRDRPGT